LRLFVFFYQFWHFLLCYCFLVSKWMICVACIACFDSFFLYIYSFCFIFYAFKFVWIIFFLNVFSGSYIYICLIVLRMAMVSAVYMDQFSSSLYLIVRFYFLWFRCVCVTYKCYFLHVLVEFYINGFYILFDLCVPFLTLI